MAARIVNALILMRSLSAEENDVVFKLFFKSTVIHTTSYHPVRQLLSIARTF